MDESWSRPVGPRLARAIFNATKLTKRTKVEQGGNLEQARPAEKNYIERAWLKQCSAWLGSDHYTILLMTFLRKIKNKKLNGRLIVLGLLHRICIRKLWLYRYWAPPN